MRKTPLILVAALPVLAGCSAAAEPEATPSASPEREHVPYYEVVEDCGGQWTVGFESLDDGATLTIQTSAPPIRGASQEDTFCVLGELGMSEADQQRVGQTRALDGQQTADWDGYEATWTYHPDDGLQFVIEQVPFD